MSRNHSLYYTKFILLFSSIIIIILLIYFSITFINKYQSYFYPPKERDIYKVAKHNDDTIRIAYIGDSWALGHKQHSCVIEKTIEDSLLRPTLVKSYGIGGLTSKEIYHAFFEVEGLKDFIREGYHYCFLSAGINDASKKMSTEYYTTSIDLIIRFLLVNNIYPIILEIPDYNINKVYNDEKITKKIIRYFSLIVNDIDIDCKQEYRDALNKLINGKYNNKVSIIPYQTWNSNYESNLKELYISDELHLNNKGYLTLDRVIASEIIRLNNDSKRNAKN